MIEIQLNNGMTLQLNQVGQYGKVTIDKLTSSEDVESSFDISAGDMVMLLNYYQYVKRNDIRCDFVNPNGSITRD